VATAAIAASAPRSAEPALTTTARPTPTAFVDPFPESDWEEKVEKIVTVVRDPATDSLTATVKWSVTARRLPHAARPAVLTHILPRPRVTGRTQKVPVDMVNLRCPQKIIKFYQSHLKWA
jgi:hypothetical protein